MSQTLANRMSRIVSGGFDMLLDAVEGAAPEAVMEPSVREVDGAIEEGRAELGRTVAAKHLASTRLMEENRQHGELGDRIELAVGQGRDDLAETAIARQMDIEAQIPILEQTVAEKAEQERELEGYVAASQAKKRELQGELRRFRASRREAERATAGAGGTPGDGASRVDRAVRNAEAAFDRVIEGATGLPASGGDLKSDGKLAELEKLPREHRTKERLAAAKARNPSDPR